MKCIIKAIYSDKTGFVAKKYMKDNIRFVVNVIEFVKNMKKKVVLN